MTNDESESTTVSILVTKFQLLIDGCNGPIRFRERNLRRRDDGYSDVENDDNDDNDDDNDNVILSFLRPDSIFEETHNNYYKKTYSTKSSSKQTKKKTKKNNGNNSKNGDPSSSVSTPNTSSRPNWNDPERLDMIPLLKQLLKMKMNSNESEDNNDDDSLLFHSVSVIFDGISMTKRPSIIPIPPPTPSSIAPEDGVGRSQQVNNNDIDEERERIWLIQNNDHPNSAILLPPTTEAGGGENDDNNNDNDNCNESSISSSSRNSSDRGTIKIEITGLYDEADNVIVDRIVQLQEKQQRLLAGNRSRRRIVSSSSRTDTDTQHQKFQKIQTQTQIQILHRTEQGPGKNRCLLQSIGLLRSESVACIFDFDLKDATAFARLTKDGQKTIKSLQRNRLLSSMGMIDIETTTISHPQMKYDIKEEDSYEEEKEADYRTATTKQKEDNTVVIIVPIVVTDDVFLRQRIIEDTTHYHSYADSSNNSGNGNGNGNDNDDNDNDDNLIFAGEDDNDVEVVSNHSNNRIIKGGYVLTFHQLWHMLMDVKNT